MDSIAGLPVRNTSKLITADTKLCVLCFAPSGFGKTTLGATLDRLTKKFVSKPSLFIAVEAGEGGGTMALEGLGIEYVTPQSLNELEKVLAFLTTDKNYGGVVVDSASELIKRFIQPYALTFPSRERTETRKAGVPERSDYQIMGEKARQYFNQIINLTTLANLDCRKHLFVTALEKDKMDDKNNIVSIRPDLPGQMADAATAMFQTVLSIGIKPMVEPDPAKPGATRRVNTRVLLTDGDGVRQVKDRTKLFPYGCEPDLAVIYEKYWLPKIKENKDNG